MLSLSLTACSTGNGSTPFAGSPGGAGEGGGEGPPGSGVVRDGFYPDNGSHALPFRTEMRRVERHGEFSLLRFALTNLGREEVSNLGYFDLAGPGGLPSQDFGGFALIDPVGRKGYGPLRKGAADGPAFGSYASRIEIKPKVRYGHVYFPPVPAGVKRVTVGAPGSPGLFPGVPVVDGGEAPKTSTAEPEEPTGPTATLPAVAPTGDVWREGIVDLYAVVEAPGRTTSSGAADEKIALRTDVLFAFDSARLSGQAKAVLDQIAGEVRGKADPAKPPITVEGHTDGKGTRAYNLRLSRQRAEAVRRELATRLGGAYEFGVSGKAETEPLVKEGGPNDVKARARNRRVEISYRVKQAPAAPAPATAARSRPDGPPVSERTTTIGTERVRLRVMPFYRDGAFLAAPFEITFLGQGDRDTQTRVHGPFNDLGASGPGDDFNTFNIVDPATGLTYRTAHVGTGNDRAYLEGYEGGRDNNVPIRSFIYVAGPPAGVTKVTFNAGPFGAFPDVPVR
jgi:OOP family OmpA-OmpF porin